MAISQNGYRANDPSLVSRRPVAGTDVGLTVRTGAPGDLLLHWAAWFDKAVENIDNARGHLDDWGFNERPIRGSTTTLSNHASGTAIDLNATRHPLGKTGTFTPGQTKRIRDELAKYEGVIRWGGDYHGRKDEMHFEIMASPARCAQVLAKLTKPAPARPVELNHVEKGRELITAGIATQTAGIAELRKAPKKRTGVHNLARDEAALVVQATERLNRKTTPRS